MAEYTTQMDAARQGLITEQMRLAAEHEGIAPEELPANKGHKGLKPYAVGRRLKTKINVNLGTSRDCLDLDVELAKVQSAVQMGAEAIMDLSTFGDTRSFRRRLAAECPAMLESLYPLCRWVSRAGMADGVPYARGGRRGFYDYSLRDEPANGGAFSAQPATVEYRFPRRQPDVCLDESNWAGEPIF